MKIGNKVYERCGHTAHYTCIPPRAPKEGEIFAEDLLEEKNDEITYMHLIVYSASFFVIGFCLSKIIYG